MDIKDIENDEADTDILMHFMNDDESRPLFAEDDDTSHAACKLSKISFPSCRFVLIIMGFLAFVNVYCLRVNLSVALVAMVNHTQLPYDNASHNNSDDICLSDERSGRTAFDKEEKRHGEFNWDSHTQGTVLAAFFYGYILTQV